MLSDINDINGPLTFKHLLACVQIPKKDALPAEAMFDLSSLDNLQQMRHLYRSMLTYVSDTRQLNRKSTTMARGNYYVRERTHKYLLGIKKVNGKEMVVLPSGPQGCRTILEETELSGRSIQEHQPVIDYAQFISGSMKSSISKLLLNRDSINKNRYSRIAHFFHEF